MSNLSTYHFDDYKDFLKATIEEHAKMHGYRAKLAKAAGCQRSFLSQVLHSHVHLTCDHAAGLADFWKFDSQAAAYFLDLVSLARASSPALKRLLKERITEVQRSKNVIHDRIKNFAAIPDEYRTKFYSAWYMSAIYTLVGIEKLSTPKTIAKHLHLDEAQVLETLHNLKDMGVAIEGEKGWKKSESHLYLKDSAHRLPFLTNWRQISSLRLQTEKPDSIHLTHLYVLSRKNLKKVRAELSDFVDTLWNSTTDSNEEQEEAVCFNIDLFSI